MTTVRELIGDIEVADVDFDEGEIITEVFVIIRSENLDRDVVQTCYTASSGLYDDPLRLGILQIVSDRIRHCALHHGWGDE